ncbi:hypothetical protein BXZ70DRAFT_957636 [Cristinia sonorae]|uniref:Dynamin N-terminal domain-containing protein n=1 Tax=Cristinia sonorae TaxID=1940300 RepID=A0A8K0UF58_9AGAR|nr:hypothetical protein BXZ70DRAFT_957636 [Cristinia sonorae]
MNTSHQSTPTQLSNQVVAYEVDYSPEAILEAGHLMIEDIETHTKTLELGYKLRKDVWAREVKDLQSQRMPITMIGICGATGSGKSSLLNAVLDDNYVPTSGMRACTSVVTEISYHGKSSIEGDVSFLSDAEWRAELGVLLDDLKDADGNLKHVKNMRSEAGIAWSKVHAVYPSVTQEQLITMTVDEIIDLDIQVAGLLGMTKCISAHNSATFNEEMGKYIDSTSSGKKKPSQRAKGKKVADPSGSRTVKPSISQPSPSASRPTARSEVPINNSDEMQAALWPLIRQVKVRCNAKALSTGAILIDLPGVADANPARNSIARDYMKKCDRFWILAPITRAIDDKTARDLMGEAFRLQRLMDGRYDDNTITFVATKCDDVSATEIIKSLGLEHDPALEEIEAQIETCQADIGECEEQIAIHKETIEALDVDLAELFSEITRLKGYFRDQTGDVSPGRKRKGVGEIAGSPKRQKLSNTQDETHPMEVDGDDDSESASSLNEELEESESSITPEALRERIEDLDQQVKDLQTQLREQCDLRNANGEQLAALKKAESSWQREKISYCSLKRNEFSCEVLKEEFRLGLKELDDSVAMQRNASSSEVMPEKSSPDYHDYYAMDLPVFTCSSRDYSKIRGQVKGDGEPVCFSDVNDTGIPQLQQWCHSLTFPSRERTATNFLARLRTFVASIQSYVQDVSDVTPADREALRARWESADPRQSQARSLHCYPDQTGNPAGVMHRLVKDFTTVVGEYVCQLQKTFRDGLEEKCKVGAIMAAEKAIVTAREFANGMHWRTYRATLRRHGSWKGDLNVVLCNPFTRHIASSWVKVFEADLFASVEKVMNETIMTVLTEIELSAPPGLRERAKGQAERVLRDARFALVQTLDLVREVMHQEQKEVSHSLAPHVQEQLVPGYDSAAAIRGQGSVAKQKDVFQEYLKTIQHNVFADAAGVIIGRLSQAAQSIGHVLNIALSRLAEKIEVSVAVLWEGPRDREQMQARKQVIIAMSEIMDRVQRLQAATNDEAHERDTTPV